MNHETAAGAGPPARARPASAPGRHAAGLWPKPRPSQHPAQLCPAGTPVPDRRKPARRAGTAATVYHLARSLGGTGPELHLYLGTRPRHRGQEGACRAGRRGILGDAARGAPAYHGRPPPPERPGISRVPAPPIQAGGPFWTRHYGVWARRRDDPCAGLVHRTPDPPPPPNRRHQLHSPPYMNLGRRPGEGPRRPPRRQARPEGRKPALMTNPRRRRPGLLLAT